MTMWSSGGSLPRHRTGSGSPTPSLRCYQAQHRAADGWVYCCAVIDAFRRKVVGWSIADHVRSELVVDALEMARWP